MSVFKNKSEERAFEQFVHEFNLSTRQQEQFLQYLHLLLQASQQFNLTAILDAHNVIDFHFRDSLIVTKHMQLDKYQGIADIGTGGGLPGIPLKICYPEIPMTLIEVKKKKLEYLQQVIDQLQLPDSQACDLDWRTFLRKTAYNIDLFLSRASLHTDELMRMFKPSCYYNKATLVYWASKTWQMSHIEQPFFAKEIPYNIKNKQRKLVVFKKS